MKKITIQQVKNGFSVSVTEEKPQISQGFEGMINNIMGAVQKSENSDSLLNSLTESKENGVYVFKTYLEVIGFLNTLEIE